MQKSGTTGRPSRGVVRERILAAARVVFARQGFDGATIDAIAESAGFTKGAVYSNFGSKDELFLTLLDDQIESRLADIERRLGGQSELSVETIWSVLDSAIYADHEWQLLFTEYWLRAMRNPSIRRHFTERRQVLHAAIQVLVVRLGLEDRINPHFASVLVLALNSGLIIEEMADPGTVPKQMFSEVIAAVIAP